MVKKELLSLIGLEPDTIFYSLKYLIFHFLEEGVDALLPILLLNTTKNVMYKAKIRRH